MISHGLEFSIAVNSAILSSRIILILFLGIEDSKAPFSSNLATSPSFHPLFLMSSLMYK